MSRSDRSRDASPPHHNGDASPSARSGANGDGARDGPVVTGAGGVVFDPEGRVLLLRHRSGSWVFPKGHIEAGEGPLDAALREVEEEAGVEAECVDPDRTWTTRYHNPRGERRQITWYWLRTDAREPVLREPLFPAGAFLRADAAIGHLSFAEDRGLLRALLRETGQVPS